MNHRHVIPVFWLALGALGCGATSAAPSGDGDAATPPQDAHTSSDAPAATPDGSSSDAPETAAPTADSGGPLPGPTGIGDSCIFTSDCPAGATCDLVCVRPCTTDADCAGSHGGGRNAQGVQNRCVQTLDPTTNTVSLMCAAGCITQNECNPLGLLCKPAPDGDAGTAVMICEQV